MRDPISPLPARGLAARLGVRATGLLALTLAATLAWSPVVTPAVADEPTPTGAPDVAGSAASIDPLTLALDQVTPSVLRTSSSRSVVLTGTVTNVSDETWTTVNIAPFRSATPITSARGLTDAAATPSTEYVGDRLTAAASLTVVDSLAPGESARFSTEIPRSALGSTPGVYWVGVHASGQTQTRPRDEVSDGRARTFLPITAEGAKATRATLVLPVRTRVRHEADGTLADANSWAQSVTEGGHLSELLAAGRTASRHPVTWLVDPAVLHAVAQLAAGNPGWELTASDGPVSHLPEEFTSESPDPEPSQVPDSSPSPDGDAAPDSRTGGDADDRIARAARAWLREFVQLTSAPRATVRVLPYGDIDVAAVSRQAPELLTAAQKRGLEVIEALGITGTPAVAAPEGVLPAGTISNTVPGTLVLFTDTALSTGDSAPAPSSGQVLERTFVTASGGIAQGGPGPEEPGTAVAVRQRTLSEAAIRSLTGNTDPLVIVPPSGWDAAEGTRGLVSAFDQGLLDSVPLSQVTRPGASTLDASALGISDDVRAEFLPRSNVRAAARAANRGALLESMLTTPAGMDQQARDVALSTLAYTSRSNPSARRKRTVAISRNLGGLIGSVTIQGPSVVTLSGSSGRLGATVRNGLDVPVTVNVEARSEASLQIDVPNPVSVPPKSRNRLLLQADRVQQGVTRVTLNVTTLDGTEVGTSDSFSVRSSQVSGILWLVIGGGAAVLFGAIGIRVFRRGLASRREQGVS